MNEKQIIAFWKKVDKSDVNSCWNWTAFIDRYGYGRLNIDSSMKKAHRLSFELHIGNIPHGLHVCHKCDNRKCVNPNHLFIGSNFDNHIDAMNKGRRKGKFVAENTIKRIKIVGDILPVKDLSKIFGLNHNTIRNILCGNTYKHIAKTVGV